MHDFGIKFSKNFCGGGTAPFPDPTPYSSALYFKLLDPPLNATVHSKLRPNLLMQMETWLGLLLKA